MYAQLGSVIFNAAKSFTEFSERASANYAEHLLIDGKPLLQRTGLSLNEVSLSAYFHHSFCDPKVELNALKDARNNGEVMPLIWGNGEFEGDFVIVGIDATRDETAPDGTLLGCSVQFSLKEFVVKDKVQQEQNDNRNKAKAVGSDKKPVAKKKTNPGTCPQVVSKIITSIENHAAQINSIVLESGGGNKTFPDIRRHNTAIQLLCEQIQKKSVEYGSCLDGHSFVVSNAASVKAQASIFNNELISAPQKVSINNGTLQQRVRSLKAAGRSLTNQAITRK